MIKLLKQKAKRFIVKRAAKKAIDAIDLDSLGDTIDPVINSCKAQVNVGLGVLKAIQGNSKLIAGVVASVSEIYDNTKPSIKKMMSELKNDTDKCEVDFYTEFTHFISSIKHSADYLKEEIEKYKKEQYKPLEDDDIGEGVSSETVG